MYSFLCPSCIPRRQTTHTHTNNIVVSTLHNANTKKAHVHNQRRSPPTRRKWEVCILKTLMCIYWPLYAVPQTTMVELSPCKARTERAPAILIAYTFRSYSVSVEYTITTPTIFCVCVCFGGDSVNSANEHAHTPPRTHTQTQTDTQFSHWGFVCEEAHTHDRCAFLYKLARWRLTAPNR